MAKSDSTGPGRDDKTTGSGLNAMTNGGAGTGPGRKEGTANDGHQGGRGTGSGRRK